MIMTMPDARPTSRTYIVTLLDNRLRRGELVHSLRCVLHCSLIATVSSPGKPNTPNILQAFL
jgi:hypothetical protein